jgi:hypothetical protein
MLNRSLAILTLLLAFTVGAPLPAMADGPYVNLRGLVHIQNFGDRLFRDGRWAGTTGQSLRLEGLQILRVDLPRGTKLEYDCHLQDIGDVGPFTASSSQAGGFCGTRGQSRRLEAFSISLIGPRADKFDVYYECHLQDIGDVGPFKNGELCGTRGESRRLEALRIWILRDNR